MKLPRAVLARFREHGKAGGHARARRMPPENRKAVARLAARRRWTRERFGHESFAALGLPGGEILDAGLADLDRQAETVESLLVSIAEPRLRREGVPMSRDVLTDPEERLYRSLERSAGDLAHARYSAYLRQAAAFCDACRTARRRRKRHAR